jgi:hypothetical protein
METLKCQYDDLAPDLKDKDMSALETVLTTTHTKLDVYCFASGIITAELRFPVILHAIHNIYFGWISCV